MIVSVPLRRGTARRLGLRRPRPKLLLRIDRPLNDVELTDIRSRWEAMHAAARAGHVRLASYWDHA